VAVTTPARRIGRLAAVTIGLLLPMLAAVPAYALDDGESPGKPLGTGLVLLYYVVIPVGVFLVIAFFSTLPAMLSRPRYRPGRPWQHDPLWFNGPDDPDQAVAKARPGGTAKGGASAEW
jgi:hypothetical protein